MNTSKILAKYKNGNTKVIILEDGTKIRSYEGVPSPIFPESIDCKLTNFCDLGCAFCHENSTTEGKHADLEKLIEILDPLPPGIELALGGGNPLDHPDLLDFLMWCKSKGFIANMTINQGHLEKFYWDIVHLITDDLIKGVGISITSKDYSYIEKLKKITNNIVYHLILGIHKPTIFNELEVFGDPKYLLLGYKTFGRGVKYFNPRVTKTINYWNQEITNLLNENKGVISFDNLAIEQLELESKLDSETWNKFYMGDDFVFTMYIDAVNQEYAPTSRSSYSERISFKDATLINYFKENRNV